MRRIITAAAAALALLSACSSVPYAQRQQQTHDRFMAYAGPPVDQFTWLGHFDSWESLSRSELVVSTTPWDAYYLKIWLPCDTRFANRVGLSSTARTVYSRLDSVIVGRDRCPIEEIRPIDYRRMKADMRRDAKTPPPQVTK